MPKASPTRAPPGGRVPARSFPSGKAGRWIVLFSLLERAGFESRIPLSRGRGAEDQTGFRNWTPSSWLLQSQVVASRPSGPEVERPSPLVHRGEADARLSGFSRPSPSTPHEKAPGRQTLIPSQHSQPVLRGSRAYSGDEFPAKDLAREVSSDRAAVPRGVISEAVPKVQVLKPAPPRPSL